MVIKVFISSVQGEFSEEREFIHEKINNDSYFSRNVRLFVFEIDGAKTEAANEVFLNEVDEADVYIGLSGQHYGNIYVDDISATEYEYNTFIANKHDAYFFVKDCKTRDEGSKKFFKRIEDVTKYDTFTTKEELLDAVKNSLQDAINKRLTSVAYDDQILYNSSIDDVDAEALELFKNALGDSKIKELFDVRKLDKILEYIGASKIDYNNKFHLNKTGALFFATDITKFDIEHEIKMVRFNGIEPLDVIDKLFSHESFFKLINDFDNFFERNTRLGGIIKGWERIPIPEYPIEAVRKAFINALAHRNYTLTGGAITFYI